MQEGPYTVQRQIPELDEKGVPIGRFYNSSSTINRPRTKSV